MISFYFLLVRSIYRLTWTKLQKFVFLRFRVLYHMQYNISRFGKDRPTGSAFIALYALYTLSESCCITLCLTIGHIYLFNIFWSVTRSPFILLKLRCFWIVLCTILASVRLTYILMQKSPPNMGKPWLKSGKFFHLFGDKWKNLPLFSHWSIASNSLCVKGLWISRLQKISTLGSPIGINLHSIPLINDIFPKLGIYLTSQNIRFGWRHIKFSRILYVCMYVCSSPQNGYRRYRRYPERTSSNRKEALIAKQILSWFHFISY